jgi:polyhydroxyalkanoate synthesis repressor PhaR
MSGERIQIARYPNRRFYARHTSKYVSLREIEEFVRAGNTVEIRDSQSDEDLTRAVLTRIIIEHHPDKMRLFPTDMLHFILRSNDVMSEFLRDYFLHSLTYLDYLQRHNPTRTLTQPIHWVKAWLDGITPGKAAASSETAPETAPVPARGDDSSLAAAAASATSPDAILLAKRVEQLEQRLRQLEKNDEEETASTPEDKQVEANDAEA